MFHPLITPLTTYMYSTDAQDGGTVSAADEEVLPPGGFSLRHGFPAWFGRGSRAREARAQAQAQTQTQRTRSESESESESTRRQPGRDNDGASGGLATSTSTSTPATATTPTTMTEATTETTTEAVMTPPRAVATATGTTPGSAASSSPGGRGRDVYGRRREASVYEVLRYIRSTFDDADVLDSVPLSAAGNPGAWHAWRTHRRQTAGKEFPAGRSGGGGAAAGGEAEAQADGAGSAPGSGGGGDGSGGGGGGGGGDGGSAPATTKRPEEWNWEGVWEERVKRGITTSLSESVLYGNVGAADDVVCLPPSIQGWWFLKSWLGSPRVLMTAGRSTSSIWMKTTLKGQSPTCSVLLARLLSCSILVGSEGTSPTLSWLGWPGSAFLMRQVWDSRGSGGREGRG